MIRLTSSAFICCSLLLAASVSPAVASGKSGGKTEFNEHCASCHPNGGNIINPAKLLKKADLEKNGIKSWKDIVAKMRKPGPGMTAFSKQMLSDKEAKEIAEYILRTFK